MTESGGDGEKKGNIGWSIVWGIGLVLFSIPFSCCISWFYVLLLPFTVCVEACISVAEVILRIIQWPVYFTKSMMTGRACCSKPDSPA